MASFNPKQFGYDVTFVGEKKKTSVLNSDQKEFAGGINKDDITCAICHLILRDPVQAVDCGHRFCKNCISQFHQTNPAKCPMDWKTIQVFPDIGKKREILSLQIRCQNHEEGCEWQNEIREEENHLQNCGYQRVSCELKCGEDILQKNMQKHLDEECRMVLRCEFKDYGCTFKGTKLSLDEHNTKSQYKHLTMKMEHEIQKVKNNYEVKLKEKDREIQDLKETIKRILADKKQSASETLTVPRGPYTFVMENFKTEFDKAKISNDRILSPGFFTEKGYEGRLIVYLNGNGPEKTLI